MHPARSVHATSTAIIGDLWTTSSSRSPVRVRRMSSLHPHNEGGNLPDSHLKEGGAYVLPGSRKFPPLLPPRDACSAVEVKGNKGELVMSSINERV